MERCLRLRNPYLFGGRAFGRDRSSKLSSGFVWFAIPKGVPYSNMVVSLPTEAVWETKSPTCKQATPWIWSQFYKLFTALEEVR